MIDQQGPFTPYARLGTLAEAHSTIKVWKTQRTGIASVLIMDQHTMLLRTPKCHHPRKMNYRLVFAMGCPARRGELLLTPG